MTAREEDRELFEDTCTYKTAGEWYVGRGSRNNVTGWIVYRRGRPALSDPLYASKKEAAAECARRRAKDE